MKFSCESCRAQYMIPDERVGPRGVKVRCKKCQHVNVVRRPETAAASTPAATPPPRASLEDELGAAFDQMLGSESERPQARAEESAPAAPAAEPAAAEVATEWFLAVDEQQVGPLDLAALKAKWDSAEVGPDTLCWSAGMAGWMPLSQVPQLASHLAPRPTLSKVVAEAAGAAPWQKSEGGESQPAQQPASGWRPSAASALASLVEEERKAAAPNASPPPEPTGDRDLAMRAPETTGIRTMLKELPTAPPQEPSILVPMTPSAPSSKPVKLAPERTEKGGGRLGLAIAAVVLVLAGGAGALFAAGLFDPSEAAPAIAERPAPPPAPEKAPEPEPPPAVAEQGGGGGPAEEQAAAGGTGGDEATGGAEAPAAVAEAVPPEPEEAEEEPAVEPPEEKVVKPAKTTRKRSQPTKAVAKKSAPARRSSPPPPPPRTGSRDLLAAAGGDSAIDDLFAREFSGDKQGSKSGSKVSGSYIPPAPGGGAARPAQLSQGDIAGVVVGHKSALKDCATRYKALGKASSGTVVMRWSIKPDGRTTGVKAVKGTEHAELASCITGLVRKWRFPSYSGPQMAPVDFPINF